MKTFRFLDFPVYQQAKELHQEILEISKDLKDFSLRDQIRRAALSVILNIAEGSAKKSDKEFGRFSETSIASINEVVACLDVMKDCDLITKVKYKELMEKLASIAKQLGGFIKKLKVKS